MSISRDCYYKLRNCKNMQKSTGYYKITKTINKTCFEGQTLKFA